MISRRNLIQGMLAGAGCLAVSPGSPPFTLLGKGDLRSRGEGRESGGTVVPVPGSVAAVFDGRRGYGTIANIHNFTDATIAKRGERWWMFGAGLVQDSGFHINLLSASWEPHVALGAKGWTIATKAGDPTKAAELIPPSPPNHWDVGRHCPSYVSGWDVTANDGKGALRERLYYSGSATAFGGPYSNGFAEWDGERWIPQETPCLAATEPWEYGNVSEPNVLYQDGKWHMWYSAGPDRTKRYAQGYAVSNDGKTNWKRTLFYPAADEVFDHAVIAARGRLEAVFARYNPITGTGGGLWWHYAQSNLGNPGSWSESRQILSTTRDAANWYTQAIWKPSFLYQHRDPDRMSIFFNRAATNKGARPVFSVGTMECDIHSTAK
jgi:hypothetical protein